MKISTTKSDNTKYKIKLWEVWCLTWTQFKVISYENGIQINWSKSYFEESNTYRYRKANDKNHILKI